jgi:hypothetical protein
MMSEETKGWEGISDGQATGRDHTGNQTGRLVGDREKEKKVGHGAVHFPK